MATSQTEIRPFCCPSIEEAYEATLRFGRVLFGERQQSEIAESFLEIVREVFPGRVLALRLVDLRGDSKIHVFGDREVRMGLSDEPLSLKAEVAAQTKIKAAIAASAKVRMSEKWDCPFHDIADGFAIPLTMAGELYGILDIGYPLGQDPLKGDQYAILALANQLASALRNEYLHGATRALRDYQAHLIEQASAYILGIDLNWRIQICNQSLCELLELPRSTLIGKELCEYFPVEQHPELHIFFNEGMRGDTTRPMGSCPLISNDGRIVPVVWRMTAIRHRGDIVAMVATGQDQSALTELQSQLIQAEKLSTLGQIAAGVVHELNNPLTAISVYSDFLLSRAQGRVDNGDELNKLEKIRENSDRIKVFARDLMQYARPSEGVPQRISINQSINQSLSFCEHLFAKSNVVLVRDLAPSLPDIYAVPGQFEQVVINLVTNAVHASKQTGTVTVRSYEDSQLRVVMSVVDQGVGISKEDQLRIFDPFFSTKPSGEGTGLGLCIVRNIVEDNGGTLSLDSTLGEGTEFFCIMPTFHE